MIMTAEEKLIARGYAGGAGPRVLYLPKEKEPRGLAAADLAMAIDAAESNADQ